MGREATHSLPTRSFDRSSGPDGGLGWQVHTIPSPGETTAGAKRGVAPKEQPPRNLSGTQDRLGSNSGKQSQPRLTEGESRHAGEALRFP